MEAQESRKTGQPEGVCTTPEVGVNLTAYEFGWLSAEDSRKFEQHLHSCRACLQELRCMEPVWTTLRENAVEIEEAATSCRPSPTGFGLWLRQSWRPISMVASMLFILGIVFVFRPPAENISFLSKETVHLRQPAVNASLSHGLKALRQGDRHQAKIHIQKALMESPESYEANYLLGLILLKEYERDVRRESTNLIGATVACFQKAITVSQGWDNAIYAAQSYYYLARAYLAQNDKVHAKEALLRLDHLPSEDPDMGNLKERGADLQTLCRP
ncbi:MAG: hypothetical protein HYR55_07320 [Acidobacteria bacterium]|nr:hypothetical protein [Acidobacteriota bacterium]MBI3658027.1 hypothetical protein [Acidobacteriota bacterium]